MNENKFTEVKHFLLRYPKPILKKLLEYRMIPKKVYNKYQSIFSVYGLSFTVEKEETQYHPSESNLEKSTYFKPPLFFGIDRNRKEEIWNELIEGFSVNISPKDEISVKIREIEKFLEKYKDYKEFNWEYFCLDKNILWTNELITKYQKYVDWRYIHRNPTIDWNFELVERNVKYLNWAFVSSYESLFWNVERINQFKDYIIFSTFNEKGEYKTNLVGKSHENCDGMGVFNRWYIKYKGCLSLNENVDWNDDLIIEFKDYWGWKELCLNKSIHWSSILIIDMEDYIDFKSLSGNLNVEWNQSLIYRY